MKIDAGDHVAICGRTGSGKTSTILALLQMMEVSGSIVVDGMDLCTVGADAFRSRVSVVPQDPFLMEGSLRFNLDPWQTVSDEKITDALKLVGLWDTVQRLDEPIDTAAWSTGQKQLLCVARAIAKRSKIVVFDEAMSRYV